MEGRFLNKTLNRLTFMKNKTRRNVGVEHAIIYCSWLRPVNQRLLSKYGFLRRWPLRVTTMVEA